MAQAASNEQENPNEKKFGLKQIELNLIANHQIREQQALFDFCTFIATERLAVKVTNRTTFRVENGMLVIGERELTPEEKAAEEKAKANGNAPDGGAEVSVA